MQEGINASPEWMQIALRMLAAFFTGGVVYKVYSTWLNRKKPAAEVHLTEATAAEIHVRAGSSAGDAIVRFMNRLDEAQITIDRLRNERDGWQAEYDKVFEDRDRLRIEVGKLHAEVKLYEAEIKQMRCTLGSKDLNYDNTRDTDVQLTARDDSSE
jgi:uncharacterized coiled-coil DUF342 family protein